jgi:hypothetical protein
VAARRLIAVMLVLLFLSSLAAALAPVERQSDETSTSTTEAVTEPVAQRGDLVKATIDGAAKRPQRVRARAGDQLQLRVISDRPATVELVGLGPIEDVDPVAPALFDVLLSEPGNYKVRELGGRRQLYGTIVVSRQAPKERDRARAPSRS